jgi:hypothetical protein
VFAPDDSRKNPEECEASLQALVSSDPNWCDHIGPALSSDGGGLSS